MAAVSARIPRVSVCIPVYNGADYLAESIGSVLAQTFEDLRVIVSDNCSTDATPDIVRGFTDPRVSYHRNDTNIGLVGNFNRCLALADGELVVVWHHDDVMLPSNLERKVRVLDAHPAVGLVHSNLWRIDAKGRRLRQHWHLESQRDYVLPGLDVFRDYIMGLARGALIFIGSVVARRVCYERVGGFRAELPNCCDSEMYMRLALHFDVACLGEPLVSYRHHDESVSSRHVGTAWLLEHYDTAEMIFREHLARIPEAAVLRRRVRGEFVRMALEDARYASYAGHMALCRRYLAVAARLSPPVLASRAFWWVMARSLAGPTGERVYARLRRRNRS